MRARRLLLGMALALTAFCTTDASAQQIPARGGVVGSRVKPTKEDQRLLASARARLRRSTLPRAEQELRIRIIEAALCGTEITPDDDNPEARNAKHWVISNGSFVVAPGSSPVEAIADLWTLHEGDDVPVPRIWCYKYSSLTIAEGFVRYFQDTGNAAGLAALNKLIGHKEFPRGLPNGGEGVLWTCREGNRNLLPGDQVWFDNPYFERGRDLIRQEAYRQAISEGNSAAAAKSIADQTTVSLAVGEEGSNIFCLDEQTFVRGGTSVSRLFRGTFRRPDSVTDSLHEHVVNRRVFSFAHFQQHMIDDNYTVQAYMRAHPGAVHPDDFKIERVRAPLGPDVLLRLSANTGPGGQLESSIDAMASRNQPPRLISLEGETLPVFGENYDWEEQQRVRSAIAAVLRTRGNDIWWQLRLHMADERYVLTATRGGVARNFTVGALCNDMVSTRLCLAFAGHLPKVPGRLPSTFRPEDEYWEHEERWAREHKPLYQMQIALCERAITQWEHVQQTLPGDDTRSHLFTAEEKARYAGALRKEIQERRRTMQPAHEEVLVPWLIAPSGWEGFDAERAKQARDACETRARK